MRFAKLYAIKVVSSLKIIALQASTFLTQFGHLLSFLQIRNLVCLYIAWKLLLKCT